MNSTSNNPKVMAADSKEDVAIFKALEKESNDFDKVSPPLNSYDSCDPPVAYLSKKDYSNR